MPAVTKRQQHFMGMVYESLSGGKTGSAAVRKAARSMTRQQAHDFAATSTRGLPLRKRKRRKGR